MKSELWSVAARWHVPVLLFALTMHLAACGRDRPKTISVRGKVTFGGGACPAEGYIDFQPIEPAEGYPSRPGSARFGLDGRFSVGSYGPSDGLVPGRYRVRIECWKELPDEATMSPGVSYVPEGFELPELVVGPDASGLTDLAYDVPQP